MSAHGPADGFPLEVRGSITWEIYRPLTDDERANRKSDGDSGERRSKWQEQEDARRAQMQALEPAATVRAEFFKERLAKLVLKAGERTDLLRAIVGEALRSWEYDDADLELAGIPADIDDNGDDTAACEWVTTATENQLWKALVVIALQLGRNGGGWSSSAHVGPIRAAVALGYEPSDVELALITGGDS